LFFTAYLKKNKLSLTTYFQGNDTTVLYWCNVVAQHFGVQVKISGAFSTGIVMQSHEYIMAFHIA
jgi:hypothetical protein